MLTYVYPSLETLVETKALDVNPYEKFTIRLNSQPSESFLKKTKIKAKS